jgi:hypothetical protein
MSGFPGRISFEGDETVADELTAVAIKHAEKLHAWKQTQGIPHLVRAFDLGDGRYCVVADLQNMRAIHISAPAYGMSVVDTTELEDKDFDSVGVIDVISGFTSFPVIEKESATVNGQQVEVDALRGFVCTEPTEDRFSDQFRRRRLAVTENPIFTPIGGPPGDTVYSEHAHVKASQYSGAMRRVVQLILGIGKILRPTWEETWARQNKKGLLDTKQVGDQIKSAFGLYQPAQSSQETPYIRLDFFYQFSKTHGITFDSQDKPWVIEVGMRGVHAMPLYMDPVSTTAVGRERYKAVSPELTEFLDEFGGIPLGVTLPTAETFTAMKKAGEIIELLPSGDMSEFYSKSAFSSDMGWCFNERGTEAHNTCYDYDMSRGIAIGFHFMLNIRMNPEQLPEWREKTRNVRDGLQLTLLYEVNKARRMADGQAEQVLALLRASQPEAAREKFDELEVEPSATGTAQLAKLRSGDLYHPARPEYQPQIKFPESMLGGIYSFDFGRLEGYSPPTSITCNTPMHVFFVKNRLEVVYYSYTNKTKPAPPDEEMEYCTYEFRSWTRKTGQGAPRQQGNFYSTSLDLREVTADSYTLETQEATPLYKVNYAAVFPSIFGQCIGVSPAQWVYRERSRAPFSGITMVVSVAIPEGDRCCYYVAKRTSRRKQPTIRTSSATSGLGGTSDAYILYNFFLHWLSCNFDPNSPGSITDVRCQAFKYSSSTNEGSCFPGLTPDAMDYSVCPEAELPIVIRGNWGNSALGSAHWPTQPAIASTITHEGQTTLTQTWKLYMISNSGHGNLVIQEGEDSRVPDPEGPDPISYVLLSGFWWTSSPDQNGSVAYLKATHSCLGSNVASFMDDIAGNTMNRGGPESMHAGYDSCYTGVIE